KAEGALEVEPYCFVNDLGRETIPGVADLVHPRWATRPPRTPQAQSAVTVPENGLLAPHRVGRNQEKTHDGTIVTENVNEMWGTDMSQTVTLEQGRAYVFVAVEHANSEIIGIHAARSANRFEALEPVRQGVHRCFGSIAPCVARGLKLRHDH